MEDIRLKGAITRADVVKGIPAYLVKSGRLLYFLIVGACGAVLFTVMLTKIYEKDFPLPRFEWYHIPRFEWYHILFLTLGFFLVQIIMEFLLSLMRNSQAKVFDSQIEVRLTETGISVGGSWNDGERLFTTSWSGVKKLYNMGPFITLHLKSGRGLSIYLSLANSQSQKEKLLTFIRQKAEENGIATKGF